MVSTDPSNEQATYENGVWKGASVPLQVEWPKFRQILLEGLRKFPDRVGQIDALTDHRDTYAEMADRVTRFSVWLQKQNLKKDDVISICTYNHLNSFVPLVGAMLVGVIANTWWDATLTEDMIEYFLNLAEPKIIFCDETKAYKIKKVVDKTKPSVKIVVLNDVPGFESLNSIINAQSVENAAKLECKDIKDPNEPAFILCTSGSTGYPKLTVSSCSWLVSFLSAFTDTPAINFWPANISWVSGVMNTFCNILTSSTAIVHPKPNAEIILQIVEKYKVTQMMGLNTAYAVQMMTSNILGKYDVSSVKDIVVGGSTMNPDADRYVSEGFKNAKVANAYGCTELSVLCKRHEWTGKLASCGKIAVNAELKVVDVDTGATLGPNEEGELCAKSRYKMLGYYKNPEMTNAQFDKEGWYHTGDIGYYDEDGDFFIVDRLKDLIKFRMNFHIAPSLIEKLIMQYPGVLEAAVVAKPHLDDIEQPIAFVSLQPGAKVYENDISNLVAKELPNHMQLRGGVVIMDELPKTDSGKISRKDLRLIVKSLSQ